jgi:L-seryl-tRNA(Ser) seleniumtransferase
MRDFAVIPSIDALRQRPAARALEARFGAAATTDALRAAAAGMRLQIAGGDRSAATPDEAAALIERAAAAQLESGFATALVEVVNATGVIVHTNLGRAPLADSAIERVAAIARGYASLEYDLGRGGRGRRDVHAEALLCRLTGAEAAIVVNNNAAATLLMLSALAAGREVIVSRGELVEIGGGFRVPDVMAQSGALLREVGTTNKTRAADYAAAVSERTALILRVHPSNFRIEGFTARPSAAELVEVGRRLNVPVAEDLGSGLLAASDHPLGGVEPTVQETLAAGVDVCCFSGDKLLGGPQAGILAGRKPLIDRMRRHPLMRALRVDKMTYAALEATLVEYAAGREATTVPVQRMLAQTGDAVRARAETFAAALRIDRGWQCEVLDGASAIGGGSAPGHTLPTALVAVARSGLTTTALESALRRSTPPIIARVEDDRVLLDFRTILSDQDAVLLAAFARLPADSGHQT